MIKKTKKTNTELKREAWVYKVRGESYEYEYHIESVGFFWHGHAGSAAQARVKGWKAYQQRIGKG